MFASRVQEGKDVRAGLERIQAKLKLLGDEADNLRKTIAQVVKLMCTIVVGDHAAPRQLSRKPNNPIASIYTCEQQETRPTKTWRSTLLR